MDIRGKTVMVLGGYGEVGLAVCRRLFDEGPGALLVTSLLRHEAESAVAQLSQEAPLDCALVPLFGNIFVRWSLKDLSRQELQADPGHVSAMIADSMGELTEEILTSSTLYRFIVDNRPHIIVDCINTATGLAYQNIYQSYAQFSRTLHDLSATAEQVRANALSVLSAVSIPPLIRHVQILNEAMKRAGTGVYLKMGTTGTGGMGLNIPYTHGEEQPSRMLLSKTAVAGAHSLLLFLMARTPGCTIVKELKPAAVITWKGVGKGKILKRGRTVPMVDCPPDQAYQLKTGALFDFGKTTSGTAIAGRELEGVYIDTGENGLFSADEFKAVTTLGLMESVTPEEIADAATLEILGMGTGKDVVSAISGAVMGPTYRAGFMRHTVIREVEALGEQGIAYELVGPSRVTKLIFEANLLKRCCGTIQKALASSPESLSQSLQQEVFLNRELRADALSVGIAVLLADGKTLLFATRPDPNKGWEMEPWEVTPENIEKWVYREWVDLRVANMTRWQERFQGILTEIEAASGETGSHFDRSRWFWRQDSGGEILIDPGEVVGLVFANEARGGRRAAHLLERHLKR